MNRWGEYCSDLYKYPLQPDSSLLQNDPTPGADDESPINLRQRWRRQCVVLKQKNLRECGSGYRPFRADKARRRGIELGGAQWNRSSTAESSLKNINVTSPTTFLTFKKLSTACARIAYGML
ncbi:hypothetical protein DPMN_066550 [Dreissena polymorpha]|uniref:Uncharacterized protein n=1 Tax=Dreissena polymorpha TaxID=45954 RepID=A0A9D3YTQ3_DREPO|nr:hypothetical protein DPMN_066550 [Dreissena polymorpha]